MSFISIDDRDVINNYYADISSKKLTEQLNRLKAENIGCAVTNLGENRYKITLPVVTCNGGNVISYFMIPYMHEFERMDIKHVTSAGADSTDTLQYNISYRLNTHWMLLSDDVATHSDIIDEFQKVFLERSQYRIISNSVITNTLTVSIYVRVTGL